jgi:hypothetical protein
MYRRRFDDTRLRDALTRKRSRRLRSYLNDHAGTQSGLDRSSP